MLQRWPKTKFIIVSETVEIRELCIHELNAYIYLCVCVCVCHKNVL